MSGPINDHRPIGPQPEFCELCGERWPGAGMQFSDVEGLRGKLICASKRTGCSHYRSAITFKDRFRRYRRQAFIGTGKHPVYPPGAEGWTWTTAVAPQPLLDEAGEPLLDETGEPITDDPR